MSLPTEASPRQEHVQWRSFLGVMRLERTHAQILGGSIVMLFGSGLVSALNFGYNVAVARLLGPAAFGHAAAVVTLLMLVSAITLAFQLVCAKFVAKNETTGQKSSVYATLRRRAWVVGVALGSLLIISSTTVARYLNLPSPSLVVWLALGIAFYIPLGVKRGGLQGMCKFRMLTANFVLEAVVRFVGAIILIQFGLQVTGAVCAVALSVVLAYILPRTPRELDSPPEAELPASFREGMQAIVFFVGQVIINNIDILLVKHFFNSEMAGLYAAVALVGRVLYFFSWSVVSAMFPITASAKQQNETASVVLVPLGIVFSISLVFTLALGMFPDLVLRTVFGPGFHAEGRGLDSLLLLYAAATGLYSLSVVLMAYEMSRKLANSGWVQLGFSGAIVLGIGMFHSSLHQVVTVQIVLMAVLLISSALPFLRLRKLAFAQADSLLPAFPVLAPTPSVHSAVLAGSEITVPRMKRLRPVTEAEVIAEFLKNEFHHPEFDRDRDRFERWVKKANTTSEAENALRRALLFRRRETMWRELPNDTEWWEVELTRHDLDRIQVFPRAQWRKLASGSFRLIDIVQRIREGKVRNGSRTSTFVSKLVELGERLQAEDKRTAILLIGVDESQPLTVIEGNHRMTAATLVSPELTLGSFRYVCGFSSQMTNCCWYQTNLTTLWRYARNRAKILMYDREAEIARLVGHHDPKSGSTPAEPGAESHRDEFVRKEAS
ncbi:MAG TPA: oligosaccharide flippase family protein [Terriglobales bacterium]|nr:oligosaccharide flippase family protein [Terriglobales bacterium]